MTISRNTTAAPSVVGQRRARLSERRPGERHGGRVTRACMTASRTPTCAPILELGPGVAGRRTSPPSRGIGAKADHASILKCRGSGKTSCPQREPRCLDAVRGQQRKTLGVTAGRQPAPFSNPGAIRGGRAAWEADTHEDAKREACSDPARFDVLDCKQRDAGVAPGRARSISARHLPGSARAGRPAIDLDRRPALPISCIVGE